MPRQVYASVKILAEWGERCPEVAGVAACGLVQTFDGSGEFHPEVEPSIAKYNENTGEQK